MKGWIFKLVCPGNAMSIAHERLLLLKNATVNRNLDFNHMCTERYVNIAYYNHRGFTVKKGKMVQTGPYISKSPTLKHAETISREWEVQDSFFSLHNIKPHWFELDYTIRTEFNVSTGIWTGHYGVIQRNDVDYVHGGILVSSPFESETAAIVPGYIYMPFYYYTRYPLPLSPIWNLLGLFTKVDKFGDKYMIEVNMHSDEYYRCKKCYLLRGFHIIIKSFKYSPGRQTSPLF